MVAMGPAVWSILYQVVVLSRSFRARLVSTTVTSGHDEEEEQSCFHFQLFCNNKSRCVTNPQQTTTYVPCGHLIGL